ncbi:hypothetical protein DFH07DRAFT_770100 [Mycena maculata]|uniref:Uncharacterized protein n=1 Tax=Mycena maculata TaxID=230809 RepID=A0AAD7NKB4_9AGAR|nr:hypothetical protein DFH07DRAFT_770100 [Mycena maculata]
MRDFPAEGALHYKYMRGPYHIGKLHTPAPKPLSTHRSTCKVTVKEEDDHSIIEVASDEEVVPTKTSSKLKGKVLQRSSLVKIKLEPELAAIAKTDSLFLDVDSDSDEEFPELIIAPTASNGSTEGESTTKTASIVPASGSVAAIAVPMATAAVPSIISAPSVTVGPSMPTTSFGPSSTSQATASLPARGRHVASFGLAHHLRSSTSSSSTVSMLPMASSSYSSVASSSLPFSFQRTGADYAAETMAMETFNEFGNYREVTPKRAFDMAILETSNLKSLERPAYNPWKCHKTA